MRCEDRSGLLQCRARSRWIPTKCLKVAHWHLHLRSACTSGSSFSSPSHCSKFETTMALASRSSSSANMACRGVQVQVHRAAAAWHSRRLPLQVRSHRRVRARRRHLLSRMCRHCLPPSQMEHRCSATYEKGIQGCTADDRYKYTYTYMPLMPTDESPL